MNGEERKPGAAKHRNAISGISVLFTVDKLLNNMSMPTLSILNHSYKAIVFVDEMHLHGC